MKVLFNASVILAGMRSPGGGSGYLLKLCEKGSFQSVISELIFNEVGRHAEKIGMKKGELEAEMVKIFGSISGPPEAKRVEECKKWVVDHGDAHVLATYLDENCDALVTLDKKHLLVLKGKIKGIEIMSPGELIRVL